MLNTIRNPGISQGFSMLAQALGGSADGAINADLKRHQRDQILSETSINAQKLADLQRTAQNQKALQDLLAGSVEYSDPATRSKMVSLLSGMPEGLQHGPKFATGAATFVDPDFVPQDDFSNVLLGTGVVNSYGDTPSGREDTLANVLAQQGIVEEGLNARNLENNQYDVRERLIQENGLNTRAGWDNTNKLDERQIIENAAAARNLENNQYDVRERLIQENGLNGRHAISERRLSNPRPRQETQQGTQLDVSPNDISQLSGMVGQQLQSMYPDMTPEMLGAGVFDAITTRAAELYQVTRNAQTAVAQALKDLPLQAHDEIDEGYLWDSKVKKYHASAGGPTPPPAAAKPALPRTAQGTNRREKTFLPEGAHIPQGKVYVNPQTGQRVIRNASGGWDKAP